MEEESIQCDGCQCWLHQKCIGMTWTKYVTFSKPNLQYYCLQCIGTGKGFNLLSSLSRIAVMAPDIERMRAQANSDRVGLPTVQCVSADDVIADKLSTALLSDRCRWLLHQYIPVEVAGDGNCLFRYGTEEAYALLRLLTSIETLLWPDFYDKDAAGYCSQFKAD